MTAKLRDVMTRYDTISRRIILKVMYQAEVGMSHLFIGHEGP
jgi:hypothetical protein